MNTNKDIQLIQEAYAVQLLREYAPHMSISQLQNNLDLMCESELIYINTVMERILNEFWGGLKNVMGAGASGIKNAAKQMAQPVANVGRGIAGAAGQVAGNVKNMYQTGNVAAQTQNALDTTSNSLRQVYNLVKKDAENNVISLDGKNPAQMTLMDIINVYNNSLDAANANKTDAAQGGFTKGAGQAYRSAQQPARNPATPPPLPA